MRATFSRRWRPILPKKSIDPGARCLRSRAFNETMMATASSNVRVQVGDRLASSNALDSLQRPEGAGMGVLFQHFPEIGRAHVCTPVTNAHLECSLLLEKKTKT